MPAAKETGLEDCFGHGTIWFMPSLYESMNAALRAHWKAHDNRYPTFVLSPEDCDQLMAEIAKVREVFGPSAQDFPRDKFHGAKIELRAGAVPAIVSSDLQEVPLEL